MAWDSWNWVFGGGDVGVVRGRLEEVADKPYGQAALAKLDEVAADGFDMEAELPAVRNAYLGSLVDYIKTLPADARFNEFRAAIKVVDQDNKFSGPLNAFAAAPANVQDAMMNAIAYNPEFVDYLTKSGTDNLSGLLTPEVLKNPQYSNLISDVLNTIANKPGTPEEGGYDFDKLDQLGKDAKAYFEEEKKGKDADQEKLEQLRKALMGSVQAAGGNIPALANLDLEKLMTFLHNLMNGDMNSAIDGLGRDLGLDGEKLAEFRELMELPAGIMKFMGQDYYRFAMHYGPAAIEGGTKYFNAWDELSNGERVTFNNGEQQASADIVVPQTTQLASADYSDIKFRTEPVAPTGQTMGDVTKMSASAWPQAHDGVTPAVTDQQVAAATMENEVLRRSGSSFAPAVV